MSTPGEENRTEGNAHSPKNGSKLEIIRSQAMAGGGEKRIDAQHEKGKLTARERIHLLVDDGSFVEMDSFVLHQCDDFNMEKQKFLGDGVVTGYATVNGKKIFLYSQDFTVLGGSLGEAHARKITKVMDMAICAGCPVIGLLDSGGARIQEGVNSLAGYGEIFYRNVAASGVIPQISVILGPCAGGAVYSPALTDFIIMGGRNAYMFVTGPNVVESVTGEKVSFFELGGTGIHGSKSGVCHRTANSEQDALVEVQKLLSYLPSNNLDDPPHDDSAVRVKNGNIGSIVPSSENDPYDMGKIIGMLVDSGSFFEIQPDFAKNIIVGFARIENKVVGIIANQPQYLGGALDVDASDKASRFIRFCDSFNIPIVTLVDVPGFLPGISQEHQGIIRHGAKLLYAYSEASVPKLTVIIRKAYGGAYIVMGSKHLGADMNWAWETAQIAVMGAEGAAKILYSRELQAAEEPQKMLNEFSNMYKEQFSHPYRVAERGHIDNIIRPEETREEIAKALMIFHHKRQQLPKRKHGVFPV